MTAVPTVSPSFPVYGSAPRSLPVRSSSFLRLFQGLLSLLADPGVVRQ